MIRRVASQADFEAAIAAGDDVEVATDLSLSTYGTQSPVIRIVGTAKLRIVALGSSQPHVVAWESSQPHVVARESSQPHVEAWGSSQPHVVAWESSQPHVVARESSQPHVEALGSSQPHVVALGSSQPHVVARESSQPHVVARGSSQPHVEALGSSQPHVVARESSQPHVVARGICQLAILGAVKVVAAATVAIVILGGKPSIEGGGFVQRRDLSTPAAWCDYYGVDVSGGIALVYKGVKEDFRSPRGALYAPGSMPVALDWDGGKVECGSGLHFSPSPGMTIEFIAESECKHFLACPVALSDMAVHGDGSYPQKCKARGLALPCWEVDRRGRPVAGAVVSWPPKGDAPKKLAAKKRAKTTTKRRVRGGK